VIESPSGRVVVTHGHYLDWWQTWFRSLEKTAKTKVAYRKFFIETAFYQALAASVSYTPGSRKLVDGLVGPAGIAELIGSTFEGLFKGKDIDNALVKCIASYLGSFREYDPLPRYFIFGHTHAPGSKSVRKVIDTWSGPKTVSLDIYNAGSFIKKNGSSVNYATIAVPTAKGETTKIEVEEL
jgi:predicted phosphodiesterase